MYYIGKISVVAGQRGRLQCRKRVILTAAAKAKAIAGKRVSRDLLLLFAPRLARSSDGRLSAAESRR
jgi:hypothetical protein